MNLANLASLDVIGGLVGFLLTLFVFSYFLGDNPLFRLAAHLFIGVAAGFGVVVAWYSVLWPQLFRPLISGTLSERLLLLVPLILAIFLFTKIFPRRAGLASITLASLTGAGAATLMGGAVLGTLFPQTLATINLFDQQQMGAGLSPLFLGESVLLLVGVVTTLIYFQFGARQQAEGPPERAGVIEVLAGVGRIFIAIAFGALFAGILAAAIVAMIERLAFLVDFILSFVPR